jgi:hypothetical protein
MNHLPRKPIDVILQLNLEKLPMLKIDGQSFFYSGFPCSIVSLGVDLAISMSRNPANSNLFMNNPERLST